MSRSLQCRQGRPDVIIIGVDKTADLGELIDSIVELNRSVVYLLMLITQLIQVITAVVNPVVGCARWVSGVAEDTRMTMRSFKRDIYLMFQLFEVIGIG